MGALLWFQHEGSLASKYTIETANIYIQFNIVYIKCFETIADVGGNCIHSEYLDYLNYCRI